MRSSKHGRPRPPALSRRNQTQYYQIHEQGHERSHGAGAHEARQHCPRTPPGTPTGAPIAIANRRAASFRKQAPGGALPQKCRPRFTQGTAIVTLRVGGRMRCHAGAHDSGPKHAVIAALTVARAGRMLVGGAVVARHRPPYCTSRQPGYGGSRGANDSLKASGHVKLIPKRRRNQAGQEGGDNAVLLSFCQCTDGRRSAFD
jgi:hypothetical protein